MQSSKIENPETVCILVSLTPKLIGWQKSDVSLLIDFILLRKNIHFTAEILAYLLCGATSCLYIFIYIHFRICIAFSF